MRFVGALGADPEGAELCRADGAHAAGQRGAGRQERTNAAHGGLVDPGFDQGRGERTFLNTIGAAGQLTADDLDDDFFDADLVVFGGTALVPQIHDSLDRLLPHAKSRGAFTVVNTVYDFRHQRQNPEERWPLGASDASYPAIDLLIADQEEALRLSGTQSIDDALAFFIKQGVGAAIVTNGAREVAIRIASPRFEPARPAACPCRRRSSPN